MRFKSAYFQVGFGMACAWLFMAVSFYVSTQTAGDWFARSGAALCLAAAAANFALVKLHQNDLARIVGDSGHTMREKAETILKPPSEYKILSRLSYFTGFVGTAIWYLQTGCS